MPKMTALTEFKYGSDLLKAGETFDCDDKYVRVLTAIGKAEMGGSSKPAKKAKVPEDAPAEEAAPAAEPVAEVAEDAPTEEAPQKAQTYQTRDMKADSE